MTAENKKNRMHLDLRPVEREKLEALRDDNETGSLTEAIRRAIGLYAVITRAYRRGATIHIHEADGTTKQVEFI